MSFEDLFGEVIVYGAGKAGTTLVYLLKNRGINVISCFDNDDEKVGHKLWGEVEVIKPCFFQHNPAIVVSFYDKDLMNIVEKNCKDLGYTNVVKLAYEQLREYVEALPDKEYLEVIYKERVGSYLNLDSPDTFNEKLQWLKLYDRKPIYTTLVDKFTVKEYVAGKIGLQHIIPTFGVYDGFEEIDFDKLPNKFVLKCTHDSGSVVICNDKSKLNFSETKKKLEACLATDYYSLSREWPYKDVKPRIIVEQLLEPSKNEGLNDYKILNFNGDPRIVQVDMDRFNNHKRNLYDTDWNYINARIQYPNDPMLKVERPNLLNRMLEFAKRLSEGIPFVRTDFYCFDNMIFFGEMTFFHEAGFGTFQPDSFNYELGKLLTLPQILE